MTFHKKSLTRVSATKRQSRIRKEVGHMVHSTTYVGLDVHKASISAAIFLPDRDKALDRRYDNDPKSLRRLAKDIQDLAPGPILSCYEAGCLGFALQRKLESLEIPCQVIAPSLIPEKKSDRLKTDKRDARKLGSLLRAGQLTKVQAPTAEQEAIRAVCRAREQLKSDVNSVKHRISSFLLLHAINDNGCEKWSRDYLAWLKKLQFEEPADQTVFEIYLKQLWLAEELYQEILANLKEYAEIEPFKTAVDYLKCLRGIDVVTALSIVAELYSFWRFESPRSLMAFLGLTPGEHSSGERCFRLGMTKTGNRRVRRLLIQAAWQQRRPVRFSQRVSQRRQLQPGWVVAVAKRAESRLHRRFWHLLNKNKPSQKAVGAVARELAGVVWALLHQLELDRISKAA